MSADDYKLGQRIASSGGSPDWNNPDQAAGWKARFDEQMRAAGKTPAGLPSDGEALSWSKSAPSWKLAQSSGDPSQGWMPILRAGFVLVLAGVAGGWFAHVYGETQQWSGIRQWAVIGGSALGIALSITAILGIVAYAVKGMATVMWWLAAKMVWLILVCLETGSSRRR